MHLYKSKDKLIKQLNDNDYNFLPLIKFMLSVSQNVSFLRKQAIVLGTFWDQVLIYFINQNNFLPVLQKKGPGTKLIYEW